jgi:hypothetical protein
MTGRPVVPSRVRIVALLACLLLLNAVSCAGPSAADNVASAARTSPTTQSARGQYITRDWALDIAREALRENGHDPADWPVKSIEYVDAACAWVIKSQPVPGRLGLKVIVLPNGKNYVAFHTF